MDWATAYLVKSAVSRTRRMAREGKFTPETMAMLRNRGYLPSTLKAGFGLQVGNINLARRMGVKLPDIGEVSNEMYDKIFGPVGLPLRVMNRADSANHPYGIRSRFARGMWNWLPGREKRLQFQLEGVPPQGSVGTRPYFAHTGFFPPFARLRLRTLTPHGIFSDFSTRRAEDQMGILTLRHELDELRAVRRAERKKQRIPHFFSHASPDIIRREGANAALLEPEVIDRMMKFRFHSEMAPSPFYASRLSQYPENWLKSLIGRFFAWRARRGGANV